MDRRAFLKGLGLLLPAFYVPKKYFWFPGNPVGPKEPTIKELMDAYVEAHLRAMSNRIELDLLIYGAAYLQDGYLIHPEDVGLVPKSTYNPTFSLTGPS